MEIALLKNYQNLDEYYGHLENLFICFDSEIFKKQAKIIYRDEKGPYLARFCLILFFGGLIRADRYVILRNQDQQMMASYIKSDTAALKTAIHEIRHRFQSYYPGSLISPDFNNKSRFFSQVFAAHIYEQALEAGSNNMRLILPEFDAILIETLIAQNAQRPNFTFENALEALTCSAQTINDVFAPFKQAQKDIS